MKVYVANLNYSTVTESEVFELLSQYIDIRSAKIVRDADGRSKGFAFVELLHDQDIDAALELDGINFHDRRIRVQVAKDK